MSDEAYTEDMTTMHFKGKEIIGRQEAAYDEAQGEDAFKHIEESEVVAKMMEESKKVIN